MMKRLAAFLLMIGMFPMSSLFAVAAPSIDARYIIDAMDAAMEYDDAAIEAKMVNTDRLGSTSLTFDTFQNGSGDTLLVVTAGPDKGQKILRLDDDIYLYYPDADEIVRLSGSSLKNSFLGSDFSYEDLTGDDDYDDRYSYTLDGEEMLDGISCYKMTFTAKKLSETYQVQEMWIDSERFVPIHVRLSSKSGRSLKDILYSDYIHDGGIFFPGRLEVVNLVKKGSSSVMTVSSARFNVGLDDDLFSKEELAW